MNTTNLVAPPTLTATEAAQRGRITAINEAVEEKKKKLQNQDYAEAFNEVRRTRRDLFRSR